MSLSNWITTVFRKLSGYYLLQGKCNELLEENARLLEQTRTHTELLQTHSDILANLSSQVSGIEEQQSLALNNLEQIHNDTERKINSLNATLSEQIQASNDILAKLPSQISGIGDKQILSLNTLEQITRKDVNNLSEDLERYYRDLMIVSGKKHQFPPEKTVQLLTQYPVADDSNDHKKPRGTKNDNTRQPRFVHACEQRFPGEKLKYIDLGCAGGGIVLDFLLQGHDAVGLEGSNYSLQSQRAEWRILANNRLFTADITKPFTLQQSEGMKYSAQVIGAWEFFEHIAENDLSAVFSNVKNYLRDDGLFIGSIAMFEDIGEDDTIYHVTVKPKEWWEYQFHRSGFKWVDEPCFTLEDLCRGVGNGPLDWNSRTNPEMGFCFIAVKTLQEQPFSCDKI